MKKLKFLVVAMGLSLLTVSCETEQVASATASEQTATNTASQKLAAGEFRLKKDTFFTPRGTAVPVLFAAGYTVIIDPDGKLASGVLAQNTRLFTGESGYILYRAITGVTFFTNGNVIKGSFVNPTRVATRAGIFVTISPIYTVFFYEEGTYAK
jgi:hypothetical protein